MLELADLDDEMEVLFERGVTDGLPVTPPTEQRVLRMLEGTTLAPDEIVAVVAPDLVEVTVEKVAINAVMAGCKPEYLPWVIAALEAVCTDEFNIHGVLATTMPVGPVLICNGPGTRAIGMNSGVNVFGQGNRANLTIGRAVQLVVRNIGGGRPGEVDRAAHGNPGKLSFCFAEDEVGSPFTSLAVSRGFAADVDTVTVFAGEGPRCIVDQLARDADQLANTFAACLAHRASPEAGHRLRLHAGRRARARSCVRRSRLGPRDAARRASRPPADPWQRTGPRRGRHGRGRARIGWPTKPSASSAPTACCSCTPVVAPDCSLP